MKTNQLSTPAAPDWTRAKGLLADLKSSARRALAAQVLLGKELATCKCRLGFIQGRHVISRQIGESSKNWDQWCQSELQIPARTTDRWIQCFFAALKRAKARKSKEPEACRLLEIPAAELTGDELEALAKHVGRLVDHDTQAGLLEELGIVKNTKLEGGATKSAKKDHAQMTLQDWATEIFSRIPREFAELEREIFRVKDAPDYRILLQELPIDSPEDGKTSLRGIKECLERVLSGGLAKVLQDVDSAIEAKMHGTPPKRKRRKSSLIGK